LFHSRSLRKVCMVDLQSGLGRSKDTLGAAASRCFLHQGNVVVSRPPTRQRTFWEKTRATQIGRDRPRQTVIVQSGVYISVIRGRNGRIKRGCMRRRWAKFRLFCHLAPQNTAVLASLCSNGQRVWCLMVILKLTYSKKSSHRLYILKYSKKKINQDISCIELGG